LLGPLGIVPAEINIWKFIWPTLLILLGVWFLVVPAVYRGRKLDVESISVPLDGAREARVRLKHGAGKLQVAAAADADVLLDGEFGGGVDQSLHRDGESVRLKLRTPPQVYPFPMSVRFEGLNWKIGLNPDVSMRLDVDSGASETVLDLADLMITELNIDTGASSTRVDLPKNAGETRVRIESGAASVVLHVPEPVSARIRVESGLAGINVDQRRFPRMGNYYQSADYEQAANKVNIFVKTGVGSLEVN
jgi:hypothetical protein